MVVSVTNSYDFYSFTGNFIVAIIILAIYYISNIIYFKNRINTYYKNTENNDSIKTNTTEEKKYCPNCGKEIELNWKFCNNCGYKI